MRLCALLSWYAEDPAWLHDTVHSLPKAGVTHLVATDGAYALVDGGSNRSSDAEYTALRQACRETGIRPVIYTPATTWPTEMAKRTTMFGLGEKFKPDWFLIIDGDETLTTCPDDLHQILEQTDLDVAEVKFRQPHPNNVTQWFPLRILFRATPGIRVVGNHYTYLTSDGRKLWGRGRQVPALDLTQDFLVEHRTNYRAQDRKAQAVGYYRARDTQRVEMGRCERCGGIPHKEIPTGWEQERAGRLVSDWVSVCPDCEVLVKIENAKTLRGFGLDPATIQVNLGRAA